jgi:hypothetical protein
MTNGERFILALGFGLLIWLAGNIGFLMGVRHAIQELREAR